MRRRGLRIEQALRIDGAAPRRVDPHDFGTAAARNIAHALAEHAVDADDRGVAGFEEVDEAGLHAGRAGAADGQRERVARPERDAQAVGDLVEHDEEIRVEVAEHRPLERFHHLGVRVRRPRPEQQSVGVHQAIVKTSEAVEDVRLRHEHLVEVEVPQHRHDDDRAADDHVDAAWFEPGVVAPLFDGFGGERAEHLFGGGACQPEVMDAFAFRRVDAELDRGHGPHRSRGADQRLRGGGAGHLAAHVREVVAHDRHGLAQLFGRGRVAVEELLGQPHAADVDGDQPFRRVGADDELGGAAAHVEHEVRRGLVEPGRRPRERERGLFLARDELGSDTHRGICGREEVLPVGRVAATRWWRSRARVPHRARRCGSGTRAARRPCARSRPDAAGVTR